MEAFVTEITELQAVDGSLAGSWVLIGIVMHQLIDRLFIFIGRPCHSVSIINTLIFASTLAPLARLIQNGFTGETRKTGFSQLLVHFNPGLQNSFTLQCLDLRKIDEAKASISHAKEALKPAGCWAPAPRKPRDMPLRVVHLYSLLS